MTQEPNGVIIDTIRGVSVFINPYRLVEHCLPRPTVNMNCSLENCSARSLRFDDYPVVVKGGRLVERTEMEEGGDLELGEL